MDENKLRRKIYKMKYVRIEKEREKERKGKKLTKHLSLLFIRINILNIILSSYRHAYLSIIQQNK